MYNSPIPFMDEVHAMTFQKKIGRKLLGPISEKALRTMRISLRQANKFILDDDAVKLICDLSVDTNANKLAGWSFLARLPYDYTWIEFDQHVKVKHLRDLGRIQLHDSELADVSPIKGMLLFKDDDDTRWVCQTFQKLESGHIVPDILMFIFDPEGSALAPIRGSKFWNRPTLSLMDGFPKLEMIDGSDKANKRYYVDAEFSLFGVMEKTEDNITAPEWFTSRSAVIISPIWSEYISKRDIERKNETYMIELRENRGQFRWLLTLLATINGLPKDVKPIKSRVGTKAAGMHRLEYFDHNIITMKVPKDRVLWARTKLDRAANAERRRQHEVIGHFRVIELGKSKHLCRHIPTMVENGLGMCERCGLMIRWINPHTRGDPRLGIVQHEYKVEGKYSPIKMKNI